MTSHSRAAAALCALVLSGCASVPRDAGLADVQRVVVEQSRQPIEWDATRAIEAPTDTAVAPLLQEQLTADRAVQIAFAHNRDLQATLEDLGVARADLSAATAIRNPVFHFEVRLPGDPRTPIEFGLVQTLIDFINRGSRRKVGQAQFEIARNRVSAAVINFAAEVRMDYFDLLAARRILASHATILKAQEASAELALRQHTAGNISDLDLEHEQSRYETVKLEHARVQLAEIEARERLIRDLGLLQPAPLDLPHDFPAPESAEPTHDALEQQVATRRLDLQIARGEMEASAREAGIARTAFMDELAIGVHYEREPDGKRTVGPEIEVPIPIFDRSSPARQRARARWRQAQQRYAALTVNARSEARTALERLLEARARMTYLHEVVVPRRQRIVQLTLTQYNAMLEGAFTLLQARQDLASAEREQILATRDYWVARTGLDTTLSGASAFSVRASGGSRRPDMSAPPTQQETKEH